MPQPTTTSDPPTRGTLRCLVLGSVALFAAAGCGGDVEPSLPILDGGDAAAGEVWQEVLIAWPSEGNLDRVAVDAQVGARIRLWLDTRSRARTPDPEVLETLRRLQRFHDPLLALEGRWGIPREQSLIRGMAIRNIRIGLMADLRLALLEGDQARVSRLIVAMATLPRLVYAHDRTDRGLVAVASSIEALRTGLVMVTSADDAPALDCDRIGTAIAWLEAERPLGVVPGGSPPTTVQARIETETAPDIRALFGGLCAED